MNVLRESHYLGNKELKYRLKNSFLFATNKKKDSFNVMKLRTKAWLVSQGLLVVTALIIQFTFHREIQVGPILKTPTRAYWDIILKVEPEIPQEFINQNIDPGLYDARLEMTSEQVLSRNLVAHRRAVRQEKGIRVALAGGLIVNILYFFGFHILYFYFKRTLAKRNDFKRN